MLTMLVLHALSSTYIPMAMNMIECSQKSEHVRNTSAYDQTMHDLVACAPNVESARVPLLWNLQ